MSTIKINVSVIKALGYEGMVPYTNNRADNLTGNLFFRTIEPTPAEMKGLSVDLMNANSAFDTVPSYVNRLARQAKYDLVVGAHLRWVAQIEDTTDLTLDKVLSTGYTPYLERTPAEVPPQAGKPSFKPGENTGETILTAPVYKQQSKQVVYNWLESDDRGVTWRRTGTSMSHRYKKRGLEVGKEYWFKVAYSTSAGEGPFSDEHVLVVLTPDLKVKPRKRRPKPLAA